MKTGWGHVINENGVDEKFAPNTLAPQVFVEEDGDTLVEALSKKIDNKEAVIQTALIEDAAITSAKIEKGSIKNVHIDDATISAAKIGDLAAATVKAVKADLEKVTAGIVDATELSAEIIKTVTAKIDEVTADKVETNELYASIIKAVAANLESLTAEDIKTPMLEAVRAEIEKLDAGTLSASVLDAVNADIEKLGTGKLYAALSTLGNATIKDADIDFAQIKDLTTKDAIFTRGTGNTLRINNLAVTEANIVSLQTGELLVKGDDGKLYSLTVDDQGNILSVAKTITGKDVEDGSLGGEKITENSLSGDRIVENSITAKQLNVQDILADTALVGAIKAENLNVTELFAHEAFISALETSLIESEYLSVNIKKAADMINSLNMAFKFTTGGLIIEQHGSQFSVKINNEEMGFYQSEQKVAHISNSQLNVDRAAVKNAFTMGDHQIIVEPNRGISLTWIGEE